MLRMCGPGDGWARRGCCVGVVMMVQEETRGDGFSSSRRERGLDDACQHGNVGAVTQDKLDVDSGSVASSLRGLLA